MRSSVEAPAQLRLGPVGRCDEEAGPQFLVRCLKVEGARGCSNRLSPSARALVMSRSRAAYHRQKALIRMAIANDAGREITMGAACRWIS